MSTLRWGFEVGFEGSEVRFEVGVDIRFRTFGLWFQLRLCLRLGLMSTLRSGSEGRLSFQHDVGCA